MGGSKGMNVLDAMAARHSARTFAPRRPDRTVIDSILRNAARAPSSGNIQPWRVRVFAGEALADLVNVASTADRRLVNAPIRWSETTFAPGTDVAAARRSGLRLYEAPVGIICTIHRTADQTEWLSHGAFVYGLDLAAAAFGLQVCIVGDFIGLDDVLAETADLNLKQERITVGIGIGYSDGGRRVQTERNELGSFAQFAWY